MLRAHYRYPARAGQTPQADGQRQEPAIHIQAQTTLTQAPTGEASRRASRMRPGPRAGPEVAPPG